MSTKTVPGRRAQVWSLDFTISFVLYLVVLLIAISILSRTFLRTDTFVELQRAGNELSERLMTSGYPSSWRASDVERIGLLTQNELSARKAQEFAQLAADDYELAKGRLNLRWQYSISFEERDGTIIPIGSSCQIGNATELKTLTSREVPVAYYYRTGSDRLRARLPANATVYTDDGLAAMLENISAYGIVVLESPRLGTVSSLYDAQKGAALEGFVQGGGSLLVIGDLNLSEAFDLNLTPLNLALPSTSATGIGSPGSLLDFSGVRIDDIPLTGWRLTMAGIAPFCSTERPCGYESLAAYADEGDFAATFRAGDGDVTFLGSLEGTVNSTGQALADLVGEQLNMSASEPMASCGSVAMPTEVEHLVTVRRLVAHRGRIVRMNVSVWEVRR